jgi:hypothetical protein
MSTASTECFTTFSLRYAIAQQAYVRAHTMTGTTNLWGLTLQ